MGGSLSLFAGHALRHGVLDPLTLGARLIGLFTRSTPLIHQHFPSRLRHRGCLDLRDRGVHRLQFSQQASLFPLEALIAVVLVPLSLLGRHLLSLLSDLFRQRRQPLTALLVLCFIGPDASLLGSDYVGGNAKIGVTKEKELIEPSRHVTLALHFQHHEPLRSS
jgi:hypothetical protein